MRVILVVLVGLSGDIPVIQANFYYEFGLVPLAGRWASVHTYVRTYYVLFRWCTMYSYTSPYKTRPYKTKRSLQDESPGTAVDPIPSAPTWTEAGRI